MRSTESYGTRLLALLLLVGSLTGCGSITSRDSGPSHSMDTGDIPEPTPRAEPLSKYGNPSSYVVAGKRYHVMTSARGYVERGIASWYGTKFHGKRTSSGEPYDMYAMTAAHTTLPLPTYVRVTNLKNGRSTVVRVNDRGPFHDNRIIDLSYAAASRLGIVESGTGLVELRALIPGEQESTPTQMAHTPPSVTPPVPAAPATSTTATPVNLYLQVGAFVSRLNAEQLRNRLLRENIQPTLIQQGMAANNLPVFRVRIGPIDSVDDADRLTQQLTSLGIGPPHVVID